MIKRGIFEFLPHFCNTCHQELILNRKFINSYESRGYPKFHRKCQNLGIKRPDVSERHKAQVGSLNPNFGNHSRLGMKFTKEWKENIRQGELNYQKKKKEILKEIPKPEIQIPITPTILSEQDKIKIALDRLNTQRLQRIKAYKIEVAKRPKEIIKNNFGMVLCVISGKFIECKKSRAFCSYYDFCKPKKY